MGAGEQNPRPSSVPLDGIPMIALLGILSILALAALCSDNRRRIPLRTVGLALCLQVLFAALVLPLAWIEQLLGESALSIERHVQLDAQQQAIDQVSISNSIGSLRLLSTIDWRLFVEHLSHVEHILGGDPAAVYAAMDFASRDALRQLARGGDPDAVHGIRMQFINPATGEEMETVDHMTVAETDDAIARAGQGRSAGSRLPSINASSGAGLKPWTARRARAMSSSRILVSEVAWPSPRRGSWFTTSTNWRTVCWPSPSTWGGSRRAAATSWSPTTSRRKSWPGKKRSTITVP